MDTSLWKLLDPVSNNGSSTTMRYGPIRPYSDIHRLLSTVSETRLSFLQTTGATWKKPNRKEGKSGFLIIRNQQLFSLEMSETVHSTKAYCVDGRKLNVHLALICVERQHDLRILNMLKSMFETN